MEWKHLKENKGQIFRNFTKEFRKQALALIVLLDTSKNLMKYTGSLHSFFFYKNGYGISLTDWLKATNSVTKGRAYFSMPFQQEESSTYSY